MATTYADLSASNPYKGQVRKDGILQQMWKSVGGRTSTDAWNENMAVQAAEYDAQLKQMQFMNEYNSPAAEVQRMREAGLNPDLQGIGDVAEAATPPDDPSIPMQSQSDQETLNKVGSFVQGIVGCFSSAIGMVNSIQGIHRNALQNSLLAFKNSSDISDIAREMAPTFLDPISEGSDFELPDGFFDNAFERAQIFARKHFPKKYRSAFTDSIKEFFSSAPGEAKAYEEWYNDIRKQKEYHHESNTFYTPSPKMMKRIYSIIGSVEERIWNLQKGAEGAKAIEESTESQYNAEVKSMLDPEKEAGAQNAEFGARKNQAEVTNILRGAVNEILSALRDDDSEFSGFFGLLLRIYSLYMFTR